MRIYIYNTSGILNNYCACWGLGGYIKAKTRTYHIRQRVDMGIQFLNFQIMPCPNSSSRRRSMPGKGEGDFKALNTHANLFIAITNLKLM